MDFDKKFCAVWNEAAVLYQKRGKRPLTVGAAVVFMEANWP